MPLVLLAALERTIGPARDAPAITMTVTDTTGTLTPAPGAPSKAVSSGHNFHLSAGFTPATTYVDEQSVSIKSSGLLFPGTTVALQIMSATPNQANNILTADDLTSTVGKTDVVVQGKTYAIGRDAFKTAVTSGKETISIGSGGIGLPKTTIIPGPAATEANHGTIIASNSGSFQHAVDGCRRANTNA